MSGAVLEILNRIRSLPEKDRMELEAELAALAEAEWQDEAKRARESARAAGLTEEAIERAVNDVRYGG